MPPRLSIVTVTYNAQDHVPVTLRSVLDQTFRDMEWLLIDGGSKDGTVAVARRMLEGQDLAATIASERDRGIYDAMNKGLALAQGDYVLFLNAGDELCDPSTLEQLFSQERTEDLLYAPLELMDRGRLLKVVPVPERLGWKDMLRGMVVSHQGVVFARRVATPYDLGFRYTADLDWCIRGLKAAKSVHRHDAPLVRYQGGGFSDINFVGCWTDSLRVLSRHFTFAEILTQVPRFAYQWARQGYHLVKRRGRS